MKAYEAMKKKDVNQLAELAEAERLSQVQKFVAREKSIVSAPLNSFKSGPSTSNISNMSNGLDKKLPSFWIPSETPENEELKVEKPVSLHPFLVNTLRVAILHKSGFWLKNKIGTRVLSLGQVRTKGWKWGGFSRKSKIRNISLNIEISEFVFSSWRVEG